MASLKPGESLDHNMKQIKKISISIMGGLLLGLVLMPVMPGNMWISLAGSTLLLSISIYLMWSVWDWAGRGKVLAWLVVLAFVLRLGLGILFTLEMPWWGFYGSEEHQHGYIFTDSYNRDQQAWDLAISTQPIWAGVAEGFYADQYGGLLTISAAIYRLLSPDAHRQILILILGALFTALGIPFLFSALRDRWGNRIALITSWIVVLYPDSVLFGASQMREPFIIGLTCIILWALFQWQKDRRLSAVVMGVGLLIVLIFSYMIALALLFLLMVLFWQENLAPKSVWWKRAGWMGLILGVLAGTLLLWRWMNSAATWDIIVTMLGSGWVTKIIKEAGSMFRFPIVVVYGISQPVLPAALVSINTKPVMYVVAVMRSLGWYLLAPVLIYSIYTLWTNRKVPDKKIWVWISIFSLVWLVVSALRAGGDQWDNPRYRVNFIVFLGLLAAWGLDWVWQKRDFWLARWMIVEFIFVGFFLHWYLGRYFRFWNRMFFQEYVVWILGLSALVLASGWVWELIIKIRKKKKMEGS